MISLKTATQLILCAALAAVFTRPVQAAPTAPTPTYVVSPQALPGWAENSTITVALTIDGNGVPHDIRPVGYWPSELRHSVVTAVAQWRFAPAREAGRAVSIRVLLPIHLDPEGAECANFVRVGDRTKM